jgi:hypothetical protein
MLTGPSVSVAQQLFLAMNLRSGRTTGVQGLAWGRRGLRTSRRHNKFYAILHENRWPNEEQAFRLSTDTLDTVKFEAHIRYLMTYMVDKDAKTVMEAKTNRLVTMAIARSLMNVAHNDKMRTKYRRVSEVLIWNLEEYNGPEVLEFPLPEYIEEFKMMML